MKVNGTVVTLDRSLEDTLPYLFALLEISEGADPLGDMDATIRKRRTLGAIKRILLRESLNQNRRCRKCFSKRYGSVAHVREAKVKK